MRWALTAGWYLVAPGVDAGLVYAQTHPDKVLALVLRGIFLCRDSDVQWFYQHGAHHLFPDYWADFISIFPPVSAVIWWPPITVG